MKKLVIMRGVSGSGKSTKSKQLQKEWRDSCYNSWCGEIDEDEALEVQTFICSADKYFIDRTSGDYSWDPKKLGVAHAWCKTQCETAMQIGIGWVCIDNTNTTRREYQSYLDLAEHFGYEVQFEKVGQLDESNLKVYANRNVHGVPLDHIRKQAKRFE